MILPLFAPVAQTFPDDAVDKCELAARDELERVGGRSFVRPGTAIAIAVGSRGIDRYTEIVRSAAQWVLDCGGIPFIVPAMGSHAGGSEESQSALLKELGIGAPDFPADIRSSTETVCIGVTEEGDQILVDKFAAVADGILLINRVKAHTDFSAPIESGLAKMLTVGLGKPRGALQMHQSFRRYGFIAALKAATVAAIKYLPPILGLAIVENERHQCCHLEAMLGEEILSREPDLLALAKSRMARLPMEHLDLLIVDEIGKNISGSGMDTNIVSRKVYSHESSPDERPQIQLIYVRSLSAETKGNAVGIGNADFCHERVLSQIDLEITYLNCLTSGTPVGAAIPMHLESDSAVMQAVFDTAPARTPEELHIAWIKNTQSLAVFYVSEAVLSDNAMRSPLIRHGEPFRFAVLEDGDIESPFNLP